MPKHNKKEIIGKVPGQLEDYIFSWYRDFSFGNLYNDEGRLDRYNIDEI